MWMHAICRYRQNQSKGVILFPMLCFILIYLFYFIFIIQMVLLTEISGLEPVKVRSILTVIVLTEKRESMYFTFIQMRSFTSTGSAMYISCVGAAVQADCW